MTAALTRREVLSLLGALGLAAAFAGGCAHAPSAPQPGRTPSPPPRAWDDSEIVRMGPWAG